MRKARGPTRPLGSRAGDVFCFLGLGLVADLVHDELRHAALGFQHLAHIVDQILVAAAENHVVGHIGGLLAGGKAASGYGMWFVMLLGAVTACVAMNDIVMLMNMQKISRVYQSMEQTIYSTPRWLQMVGAGMLAPIAEELVYRGMIYRRMRESLTAMQAGVFVSILFGVGHGNLPQGLYAMVLGFLLAGIYEKFRNIAAPVLFHIVVNITSLLLSWYGGFEWILGTEGKAVGITVLATLITVIIYVKIKNIRQEIR